MTLFLFAADTLFLLLLLPASSSAAAAPPLFQCNSFMKLRLDRVLKFDLAGMTAAEALSAGEALPEFKKPEKWTAPYAMYSPKWWEKFYPN